MKHYIIMIFILSGIFITFSVLSSENLNLFSCSHKVDNIVEDEIKITLFNGEHSGAALSKCEAKVDGIHTKNLTNTGHIHTSSHSQHCEITIGASIGNGPFN